MIQDGISAIVRDIRAAHKSDSESAPQTTIAEELKQDLEGVANLKGSPRRLRFTASGWVSIMTSCLTQSPRSAWFFGHQRLLESELILHNAECCLM